MLRSLSAQSLTKRASSSLNEAQCGYDWESRGIIRGDGLIHGRPLAMLT